MALALTLAAAFGLGVTSNASAQGFLDARVSIAFNSVSPSTMFRTVATNMVGIEATVDPQLQKPFSITLEDVTVRTVLDATCDSVGCRWHIDGNTLVVEALPPDPSRKKTWIRPNGAAMPAGSQFVNTPVSSVLDAIGRAVGEGCSYRIDAVNLSQLVTIDLSNQDELRAIAKVVRAAGLAPGSPYAVIIQRPGRKPMVIQTVLPKEPEPGDNL
jgi:type II secretory pathway component GspD/PulD (secretin)